MTVKQISVFLENKAGRLAEFTKVLRQNEIDMRALSIAETPDFGILRVIVDDPYKTACVLKDAGYVVSITPVLAAAVPDETGSLYEILNILGKHNINLEYTYAFIGRRKGTAYMIFRVGDNDKAIEVLSQNNIKLICQHELYDL
ncbi:MAG TPA: acetolactate synthase [Candidatus Gallacutalibacter stercoravium]|nr:acetolactate synthase [Candidatus Gallacutalibacter stercoravium]